MGFGPKRQRTTLGLLPPTARRRFTHRPSQQVAPRSFCQLHHATTALDKGVGRLTIHKTATMSAMFSPPAAAAAAVEEAAQLQPPQPAGAQHMPSISEIVAVERVAHASFDSETGFHVRHRRPSAGVLC